MRRRLHRAREESTLLNKTVHSPAVGKRIPYSGILLPTAGLCTVLCNSVLSARARSSLLLTSEIIFLFYLKEMGDGVTTRGFWSVSVDFSVENTKFTNSVIRAIFFWLFALQNSSKRSLESAEYFAEKAEVRWHWFSNIVLQFSVIFFFILCKRESFPWFFDADPSPDRLLPAVLPPRMPPRSGGQLQAGAGPQREDGAQVKPNRAKLLNLFQV